MIPGAREEGIEMLLRLLLPRNRPLVRVHTGQCRPLQPPENIAPPPRAADPPAPFTLFVRTIPITAPERTTFNDRRQAPPTVAQTEQPHAGAQAVSPCCVQCKAPRYGLRRQGPPLLSRRPTPVLEVQTMTGPAPGLNPGTRPIVSAVVDRVERGPAGQRPCRARADLPWHPG
jgi:hypothetical protein